MPSLGSDMEDGTLVEWLVKPGQAVQRGDIVAVVETQKGAIEIEIFDTGVIDQFLMEPGTTVPVGTPLALVRGTDEAPGAAAAEPAKAPPHTPIAAPTPAPARQAAPPPPSGAARASPAARRLAAERGIDLTALKGSGPDGAVQLADVEAAVAAPAPKPARATGFDPDQMRAAIAAAMSRSKREIPHYYLTDTIDLQPAVDWLAKLNGERPPDRRILMGALFVKAVALAARKYPEFSGAFEDGAFRPAPSPHVGVAISIRGGGLVAPAIHDTANLGLDALMDQMRDLVGRVRAGRLRSSEIADPTITVSSLGDRGVEALYGVIYPPQVAIVGVGKVVERPWIMGDKVAVRSVVTLTLAADHRVSDGHRGGLFLAEIGRLMKEPEAL